ncbi:MAG: YicC family protein [Alicyclobacillus sp.]|nr:YicC family protein [Alicyclobacillus sp.]
MGLHSMTGYGQAVLEGTVVRARVEVRTVNHRFAEFNIRSARELFFLEEDVRAHLAQRIHRGRADVYLQAVPLRGAPVQVGVNWPLLEALCAAERHAAERLGGGEPLSVYRWLTFPDVLQVEAQPLDADLLRADVLAAVDAACTSLTAMRAREGQRIAADMLAKLGELEELTAAIAERAPDIATANRQRLQQRLQDAAVDEQRIWAEAALLAERMCVDEELVRLSSHIAEFRKSVGEGSPVGRRLDFIVQEMHREVNTIGAKTNDLAVTKWVLAAKAVVEQLREQAQNIE